jgi:hypothetical protein
LKRAILVTGNRLGRRSAISTYIVLYFEKCRIILSHGLQKESPIKKEVSDLATRLSDKQAAMAGSAMGRSIPASVIRFVIGADRVIRANPQTLQRVPKDIRKSGSGGDQTTERLLGACARGVDQHAAAVEIAPSSGTGQGVNPLLQ